MTLARRPVQPLRHLWAATMASENTNPGGCALCAGRPAQALHVSVCSTSSYLGGPPLQGLGPAWPAGEPARYFQSQAIPPVSPRVAVLVVLPFRQHPCVTRLVASEAAPERGKRKRQKAIARPLCARFASSTAKCRRASSLALLEILIKRDTILQWADAPS